MESNVPISWTNEKHVQFLNTMEASFVCSMFESKGRVARLDRFVPDTSDSTLDRIRTPKTTTKKSGPIRRMGGGAVRRTRRLPSQPFISSQLDQVVPQYDISVVGDLVIKHYERCVENKNEKVAEP
ncbi:PREDICTED: uncharacterized protein LOC101298945 [Fragaria vesca subsp. vesca]|uniref:uncharacterized protein LOC101298945 n=1 Tax=Fragaria vesca subsp. vesca TaxID=101020 RepID=UPI0002C32D67|nr:PREDICTED: uncharacterized protein LOC101298945 [Fragaria vesca subsp. vesca]